MPMALVKAPFSWPNSSLSSRFSGSAAQLTAIMGPLRSPEAMWMARATISLPVPVSPSISTVEVVWATLPTSSRTPCMRGFLLRMLWNV